MYDKKRRTGGMNHFLFPYILDKDKATARYGNVAVLALINFMVDSGSKIQDLEVQLFGGAHNPLICKNNIGLDNITIARKILSKKRIHIVSEDVGGERGRKVVFNTATNEVAVAKVEKLRQLDWFPYNQKR
ncbi:MAG: chemotaxis protein CheD [Desulfobacterales bacterium]|nr:chemotaxis protein CheD [Desulfobacterales bacterium]